MTITKPEEQFRRPINFRLSLAPQACAEVTQAVSGPACRSSLWEMETRLRGPRHTSSVQARLWEPKRPASRL